MDIRTIGAIVLTLLVLICLYWVTSADKKLRRLRKKYDTLLRGRSDVSLEDLLIEYGQNLEQTMSRQKRMEKELAGLNEVAVEEAKQRDAAFQESLQALEHRSAAELREMDRRINESFVELKDTLTEHVAHVQHETHATMEEAISQIQREAHQFQGQADHRMQKIEEDIYLRFEETEKQLNLTRQATSQAIDTLAAKAETDLNHEVLRLREQMSLTLQRVGLYRYNAFEELAGEQSFSVVLLDDHNNGILVTNIYGRRGSSVFAKEIRNGTPQQNLSPEEQTALQMAKNNGK
ncbi:MAG: DUF4446 family protein [Ndongobacter sp.]|nr:DUF4446 family protein [Ndongobacter sp.]